MKIIILAGGSGTRLWPLSREGYPKQFIKFHVNGHSMFQETFLRSLSLAGTDDIYIVTNEKYRFLVMNAVEELGYKYNEENILVEPEAKNTLPAIYAGVNEIRKTGDDLVAVFPSDHKILKSDLFADIIRTSAELARDSIITFGIKPNYPNTGYGYIAPGEKKANGFKAEEFKEKPDHDTAVSYLEKGYFWNSGIFMFNTALFAEEVKKYSPNIYSAFQTTDNIRDAFSKIHEKVSIDFGIMEKSNRVAVVPADIGWNDLGSFDALYDVFNKDENGNIVNADCVIIDSHGNYIYAEKDKLISVIGAEDLIIADSKDALLICKSGESQKVKEVVSELQVRGDKKSKKHSATFEQWGTYEVLSEGSNYRIGKAKIKPLKHIEGLINIKETKQWTLILGEAKAKVDGKETMLKKGESITICKGHLHSLYNEGDSFVEIAEVLSW